MSGRGLNPNSHIDKGLRKGRLNIAKEQSMAEKQEDNLIDWCTFYRRNIHRFAEHYLGLNLHLYQKIMLYLMNLCPLVVLLCSRAVGKSWIVSVYSCCVCILYPGSKVLATAKRKHTVELLIKEKIEKELIKSSPNLQREIKKISTSNNNVEVQFWNGSTFVVSPANDDARGQRATLLIVDEFRQCDKTILDSVFSPMLIKRQPPFTFKPEYEHLKEEPREIYLSSAWLINNIITNILKRSAFLMRKYYFNEKFFDEIDTIEKAYWLGFICADGSITNSSKNTKSLRMRININEKDSYLLEELRKDIEGDMPIRYFTSNKGKEKLESKECKIELNSNYMCERLINIGVKPNKTYSLIMPYGIPYDLFPHFIRGFFDGDGHIISYPRKENKNKYRNTFGITCFSLPFLKQLKEFFRQNNINTYITTNRNQVHCLRTSSYKEIVKIYQLLYPSEDIFCLKRKKEMFEFIIVNSQIN